MSSDRRIVLVQDVRLRLWFNKVWEARSSGLLTDWVSTLHPDKLPCQIEGPQPSGSFNVGHKIVFQDGSAWLVRFPILGHVYEGCADEKVAMEVEVLALIREKTSIPVPRVQTWGRAADNPLGLGPFIMMDFIEGVHLGNVLRTGEDSQLLKPDIDDKDLEFVYRQLVRIQLQLFQVNLEKLGSLPSPTTGFSVPTRPLTFKVHDILQNAGIDTFGTLRRYS